MDWTSQRHVDPDLTSKNRPKSGIDLAPAKKPNLGSYIRYNYSIYRTFIAFPHLIRIFSSLFSICRVQEAASRQCENDDLAEALERRMSSMCPVHSWLRF